MAWGCVATGLWPHSVRDRLDGAPEHDRRFRKETRQGLTGWAGRALVLVQRCASQTACTHAGKRWRSARIQGEWLFVSARLFEYIYDALFF
jgi:hypothetical protein